MHARKLVTAAACTLLFGCAAEVDSDANDQVEASAEALSPAVTSFDVDFEDWTEFGGIGNIDYAKARAAVPSQFTPVDAGNGLGIVVVRIGNGKKLKLNGKKISGKTVAQVGVNIVAPEGDGDINNYTLYYDTDFKDLSTVLIDLGVNARYVSGISYKVKQNASRLEIEIPPPSVANYEVSGSIAAQNTNGQSYVANWWALKDGHPVKLSTTLPLVYLGTAHTTLEIDQSSPLVDLFGGTSFTFAILDSYNTFQVGHLDGDIH